MGILAILTRFSFFQLQADLQLIKEDVITVDKQRHELVRARERYSVKLSMMLHASNHSLGHAAMAAPYAATANGVILAKNEPGMANHSTTARKDEFRETMSSMTSQKRKLLFAGGPVDSNSNSNSSSSDYPDPKLNSSFSSIIRPQAHHRHAQLLRFSSISSGSDFACGLVHLQPTRNDNTSTIANAPSPLHCWGWGGSTSNSSAQEMLPNASFRYVRAGHSHACGLTETSNVLCWGSGPVTKNNNNKTCRSKFQSMYEIGWRPTSWILIFE